MGNPILAELRWALLQNLGDEAAARVNESIRRIQENDIIGPSIITLHYQNAALMTVLADFSRQCGADIGIHKPQIENYARGKTISIDVERVSFWKALREITAASGVGAAPYAQSGQFELQIIARGNFNLDSDQMVTQGAIAIVPQSCQQMRMINYMNGGKQSYISLQLAALAEPKMRVLSANTAAWLKECVDDKGNDLAPKFRPGGVPMNSMRAQWVWPLQTQLTDLPNLGTKIVRLRGELTLIVQVSSQLFQIDDLSGVHDRSVESGGDTIVFRGFTQTATKENKLDISISGEMSQNPWGWQSMFISSPAFQIMDARDRPLNFERTESVTVSPNQVSFSLYYMSPGGAQSNVAGPVRLRWEVPKDTKHITVPFEMHDLALPG